MKLAIGLDPKQNVVVVELETLRLALPPEKAMLLSNHLFTAVAKLKEARHLHLQHELSLEEARSL
jgi:hypothetical protein